MITVRALAFAATLVFAPVTLCSAAPGDLLVVIGNQVNLRQGPGTTQAVLGILVRGQIVIELERYNEWFRIDLGAGRGNGWVHGTLVAPTGEDTGASARAGGMLGSGGGSAAFRAFRDGLQDENIRVFEETGIYPYVDVADLGDATVTITPSDPWLANAGDLREQALRLYNLWREANDGETVVLVINDARGNVFVTVQAIDGEPMVTTHY